MDKGLANALLQAQRQMGKLIYDSNNPHFRSRYASLTAVLDTVRGPLSDAGLVLYQSASAGDGVVMVRSMLVHAETGESIEETLPLPVGQATPQAYGSAITYGRRYLAMAMCGIAPDDDDGEVGSKPQEAPRRTLPQKPTAQHRKPQPDPVPPATADVQFYGDNDNPFDDVPDHQTMDEALRTDAHLLFSGDTPMTEFASRLIAKCHELHGTSGNKTLSTTNKDGTGAGQYGLLAGKLDHIIGVKQHGVILSALTGVEVSKENPPGWKVKEIIDWLNDEKTAASTTQAIRDVWSALQEMVRAQSSEG